MIRYSTSSSILFFFFFFESLQIFFFSRISYLPLQWIFVSAGYVNPINPMLPHDKALGISQFLSSQT